jgi:hypothetical protein
MTDQFQLTAIIATAIRECRLEAPGQQGSPQQNPGNTEEEHCIAKAVLAALADAGYQISPKPAAS